MDKILDLYEQAIINDIAEYLERPENWRRLKDCWIVNGRSDDLRQLLKEALEREE